MPSRQEYKHALKGLSRDQRIVILYLEDLINKKHTPIEVYKPNREDVIPTRLTELEGKVATLEQLRKTLDKTIKDQRKEIDKKINYDNKILEKLNKLLPEVEKSAKFMLDLRHKLLKSQSIDELKALKLTLSDS